MNIAIDIDDTLTQSFSYFQPWVAEFFHANLSDLQQRGISYSNLPPQWKPSEAAFGKFCYDRLVPDTPFKPDAAPALARLHALGHRIVIVTGRTTDFYTDPYETTRQELANGGIVYDKLICTLDKAAACLAEGIQLLIDDLPANCASVARLGIPALLFSSPANGEENTGFLRVSNWEQALCAISQLRRGYPDPENARQLLADALSCNPGPWGAHSRVAARCAKIIAAACGMDAEKAEVLALLHDIGRRFRVRDLGHLYYGYRYMNALGFPQVAKICLSHSFPNQDIRLYIGRIDIPEAEAREVSRLLSQMEFDDYDRLIQLCDALAGSEGVLDIEARMADVKRRYGNYPQAQWDQNLELKAYFESKAHAGIYDLLA